MSEMRLENWEVEEYSPGKRWLLGNIFGDPGHHDGKYVHTSTLVEVDFPNRIAKTLNSTYRLGTPRGGSTPAHDPTTCRVRNCGMCGPRDFISR